MLFVILMILSTAVLVFSAFEAIRAGRTYRTNRILTPSRILAIGVFISATLLFFPYYFNLAFSDTSFFLRLWESFWLSVHHAIRLFVVDTDFREFLEASLVFGIDFYAVLGTILLILAPMLTFSVILSFFKNFSAYRKYLLHPMAPTCVFSELNEKSLALAKDFKKHFSHIVLMFADVFEENDEENYEITERAKELGAICFKKDMLSLNLFFHSPKSRLYFFAIAQDQSMGGVRRQVFSSTSAEEENIKQAYKIACHPYYSKRENTFLHVFSSGTQGELLLESLPETCVRVKLAEKHRPFIMSMLASQGARLFFESALVQENGEKLIHVVIVGANGFGTEMLRALVWFCQVDGYRILIDVFDEDRDAESRFTFSCPELMAEHRNGVIDPNNALYHIRFHCGLWMDTAKFLQEIDKVGTPTYVLVSLEDDESSVQTAVALRRHFRQIHCPYDPYIQAVVLDSQNRKIFTNAKHWNTIPYDIEFIADLETVYSVQNVLGDWLESEAFRVYMQYSAYNEEATRSFYGNIHNQRSALSAAMHEMLLKQLQIFPDTPKQSWSNETKEKYDLCEHRRWIAFMLSEGYVYSGSIDRDSRDPLGKMHPHLVPLHMLSKDQ